MKIVITLILLTVFVFGCSQFDKTTFLEDSFALDLNKYRINKESKYSDGLLEISDVSISDEIYLAFFADNQYSKSESVSIESYKKIYHASKESPFLYRVLEDHQNHGFKKIILYVPNKKTMVFMYARSLI